jgi:hypothetical protein
MYAMTARLHTLDTFERISSLASAAPIVSRKPYAMHAMRWKSSDCIHATFSLGIPARADTPETARFSFLLVSPKPECSHAQRAARDRAACYRAG